MGGGSRLGGGRLIGYSSINVFIIATLIMILFCACSYNFLED